MRHLFFLLSAALVAATLATPGCGGKSIGPQPDPQPQPQPEPTPPSPAAPLSVIVTYDPTAETAQSAQLWTSSAVRTAIRKRGHSFRYLPAITGAPLDATPPDLRLYLDAAASIGKNAIAIGHASKLLYAGPPPVEVNQFTSILDTYATAATPADMHYDGHAWRKLGLRPRAPGAPPPVPEYGQRPNEPTIDPADYRDVDLQHLCPPPLDQGRSSSCTACGTTGAARFAIIRTGMPDSELSVVDLYSRINNGRDGGAPLDDAALALETEGVCTTATATMYGVNNPQHHGDWQTDRTNHIATRVAWLTTNEQLNSALQTGHPVVFGTMVNNAFTPNRDGIIDAKASGRGGGHCMFLFGMQKRNGTWYYRGQNSWGPWGLSGRFLCHPSWVDVRTFGAFAVLDMHYHDDDARLP